MRWVRFLNYRNEDGRLLLYCLKQEPSDGSNHTGVISRLQEGVNCMNDQVPVPGNSHIPAVYQILVTKSKMNF